MKNLPVLEVQAAAGTTGYVEISEISDIQAPSESKEVGVFEISEPLVSPPDRTEFDRLTQRCPPDVDGREYLLTPLRGRPLRHWVNENPGVDFLKAWKELGLEPPFERLPVGTVVRLRSGVKGPFYRTGVVATAELGPWDQYLVKHDGPANRSYGWTRDELETQKEYGNVP